MLDVTEVTISIVLRITRIGHPDQGREREISIAAWGNVKGGGGNQGLRATHGFIFATLAVYPAYIRLMVSSMICRSGQEATRMQVQLARWGNSLGIRIPKDIASQVGLHDGARVDIRAEGDRIVITADRPRYSLDELMKGVTPEAMREAFDWGPDAGREIVEE
ncbi:AbrB/MazE/SpoVT family DNA-binding domain-containing protein [Azospirillum thiophilum]|nr:AbrB/MazE/SpoVT family DNA-binding domain-containing protein [Azospirillum thiophilum]